MERMLDIRSIENRLLPDLTLDEPLRWAGGEKRMFLLANVGSLHGDGGDVKGAAGSLLVTVKSLTCNRQVAVK